MGQTATCARASSCGSCQWGRECYTCVVRNPFSEEPPKTETKCEATVEAAGQQIVLPILFLALLLTFAYITYRWHRLRRIRASLAEYNLELARTEGVYAANAAHYSFSKDIFPYLLPADIRTCMIYYPCSVKMSCIPGVFLLMLAVILLPLGLFTLQTGYNSDTPRNTMHLSTAGVIFLCLGAFLCCVCCVTHCLVRKAREQLANEHDQRPLQIAQQEGAGIVLAEAVIISIAMPVHETPPAVIHPDPNIQQTLPVQMPPAQNSTFVPEIEPQQPVTSFPVSIVSNSQHEYQQIR